MDAALAIIKAIFENGFVKGKKCIGTRKERQSIVKESREVELLDAR